MELFFKQEKEYFTYYFSKKVRIFAGLFDLLLNKLIEKNSVNEDLPKIKSISDSQRFL